MTSDVNSWAWKLENVSNAGTFVLISRRDLSIIIEVTIFNEPEGIWSQIDAKMNRWRNPCPRSVHKSRN